MLHTPHCFIWFSVMVLQQSFLIIPHENLGKNAEKSHYLDTGSLQNISFRGSQSYRRSNPHQISPPKTHKQISAMLYYASGESSHKNLHGRFLQLTYQTHSSLHQYAHKLSEDYRQGLSNQFKQQIFWGFSLVLSSLSGI